MMSKNLPPVIQDFLKEKNIFPKTSFVFLEMKPSIYDELTKTGKFTSVSYFKIEEPGRLGHVIIENQDGDLRVIRNSLS